MIKWALHAVLMSIRNIFKNILKTLLIPNFWTVVYMLHTFVFFRFKLWASLSGNTGASRMNGHWHLVFLCGTTINCLLLFRCSLKLILFIYFLKTCLFVCLFMTGFLSPLIKLNAPDIFEARWEMNSARKCRSWTRKPQYHLENQEESPRPSCFWELFLLLHQKVESERVLLPSLLIFNVSDDMLTVQLCVCVCVCVVLSNY